MWGIASDQRLPTAFVAAAAALKNQLPAPRAAGIALLLIAAPLHNASPWTALWTTPCILMASVLIAWGAESAQFFVAQGFALAILAWMQTLPEFAVEAVLAWHREIGLLLANLTGALRLLTGLAWPMIYCTAAVVHRKRTRQPLRAIELRAHHSVEVVALVFPLLYALFIWWKKTLDVYDAAVLIGFYIGYLVLLTKLPPETQERVGDLPGVPRRIVLSPPGRRTFLIFTFFAAGGLLIYFTAAPFLAGILALATVLGVPSFILIQWFAPVISEFPELASTFYFARQRENAALAIVNIASSNINQWTLLMAMLPIVLSLSHGAISFIPLDPEQQSELLLTAGQSLVGLVFLINMEFAWWEALLMFVLFASQFVLPPLFGARAKLWITAAFFGWTGLALLVLAFRRKRPRALTHLLDTWRTRVKSTPTD